MNGYSKMRVSSSRSSSSSSSYTTKGRSIDFSDPTTHAYASPTHPKQNPNPTPKDYKNVGSGGGGERFGVALRRNFSSGSQRFRTSDYRSSSSTSSSSSSSSFGAVVRRAFSMRKAASVAEGYWRIDGNGEDRDGEFMNEEAEAAAAAAAAAAEEEEEEEEEEGEGEHQVKMRSQSRMKKKQKKGRIFRACKRLFGF